MLLFNNIIVLIGTAVILLSFILAFRLKNKKGIADYYSFFYWIPFLGILYCANTILRRGHILTPGITDATQNFLSLVDFLVRSYFFYVLYKNSKISFYLKIIFGATIVATVFLICTNAFAKPFYDLYILFSLVVFIFSLHYYYKLFMGKPLVVLWNDSSFWIVNGLFFYAAVNFPILTILKYGSKGFSNAVIFTLIAIVNVSVIIEHLLFIKGYHCAKKR